MLSALLTATDLEAETEEPVAVVFVVTVEWDFWEVVLDCFVVVFDCFAAIFDFLVVVFDFFEVDLDDCAKLWEIEKQTLRCTRARRVW